MRFAPAIVAGGQPWLHAGSDLPPSDPNSNAHPITVTRLYHDLFVVGGTTNRDSESFLDYRRLWFWLSDTTKLHALVYYGAKHLLQITLQELPSK